MVGADPDLLGPQESSAAWLPNDELEYRAWVSAGHRLGTAGRCSQWWLGDWMRYGSERWGEKYSKAAEISGYDVQSLRNMAYVAGRFDQVSRRRDLLSWSHHAEVAALEPKEQDRWLERAIHKRLSVSAFRSELRRARRVPHVTLAQDEGEESASSQVVTCPHCGHTFPLTGAEVVNVADDQARLSLA